jgi:hypothetical protein
MKKFYITLGEQKLDKNMFTLTNSETLEKNEKIVSSIYKIYYGEELSLEDDSFLDEFIKNSSWVRNMNKSAIFPTPEEFAKQKKEQNYKVRTKNFFNKVIEIIKLPKWLV